MLLNVLAGEGAMQNVKSGTFSKPHSAPE